jgi:hypothetical protein
MKLDDLQRILLLRSLAEGTGPVNKAATAAKWGITRPTLDAYIRQEPGLAEAIEARRKVAGTGYVQVERGTRASRRAAKARTQPLAARPRDRLGAVQGKLFGPLYAAVVKEQEEELETGGHSAAERLTIQAHLFRSRAHMQVYQALATGDMTSEDAWAALDAIPAAPALHVTSPATARAMEEREERRQATAQDFKAVEGYLPSSRKLDGLTGESSGRSSFTPEQWREQEQARGIAKALRGAQMKANPRKSYPSRPRDAQGKPLVGRGVMAKLQREAEARGLTGQAAKDAAVAAALESVSRP